MVKKFAWYPAEDEQKHYKKTPKVKIAKLRKGITPGSVLVLLAGRFRGRRVVFLKQLPSGLLLVTGPYKVNGVPLKRVNQTYTLTTTTQVDIKGVDVSKIDDALFKKEKSSKKAGENKFFADSAAKVSRHYFNQLCRLYRRRRSPSPDLSLRRPLTVPF